MHSLSILTIVSYLIEACYTTGTSKRDNITLAAPIVAVPSQHWEGVDGQWSTYEIRVGTPVTTYRVLPATSWQETWVVYAPALNVCNTSAGVAADCQDSRGGVFDGSKSSTWVNEEQGQLELNAGLGFEGVGQYGFDTIGLGFTNNTGPTMTHQIVSEIVSDSYWFGILGLGFQPTNFTSYANAQPSFSSSLFTANLISSQSWSYTAGAYYRLKGVFGSLVFGGYDAARFVENSVRFTMAPDNERDLVVTVRSISTNANLGSDGGNGGALALMTAPQFAYIDSSIPELWLPAEVCSAFASAFNLTLDNSTGYYLIDSTTRTSLLALNPNITITLANQKTGGVTTDIVLSYAAFDQTLSPPMLINRTSYYFPIRQGTDETQFALGRIFLQEAYVTAHYESRTFNVSQCVFIDPLETRIIALPSVLYTAPSSTSTNTTAPATGDNPNNGLSKGAIVGIVIGVLALTIVVLFAIILFYRRRKKSQKAEQLSEVGTVEQQQDQPTLEQPAAGAAEVKAELDGHDNKFEKDGNPIMVPQELEAVPVQRTTPMVEMGDREGGLAAMNENAEDHIVSPESAGTQHRGFQKANGRRTTEMPMRPQVVISSPTASPGNSPASPMRGSKFEEHI